MSIKKFVVSIIVLIMAASSVPAAEKWLPGPDASWQIRYDEAQKIAKKENKLIYVLATGSDWCGWCKKLKADVFSKKEFKEFAKKNLVLLYLDMPSKRVAMPLAQRQYNQMLIRALKFGGGVPSAMIVNADGRIIDKKGGYAPLNGYMQFLGNAVKKAGK